MDELEGIFYERREPIHVTVCTMLARQHTFWLGDTGTAKSSLLEALTKRITGARFGTIQMDRQMDKAELFGPIDIARYDQLGVWERDVEGFIPDLHIVLLDEIWKAPPTTTNTLLRALNERLYRNGKTDTAMPLISAVAASNELPEAGATAVWDRFLTRVEVDYIQDPSTFRRYLLHNTTAPVHADWTIPLELLQRITMVDVPAVVVPPVIVDTLVQLRFDLGKDGVIVSDRRWRQCLRLLQAAAYLAGRVEVTVEDLSILRHALWTELEQRSAVNARVESVSGSMAREIVEITGSLVRVEGEIEQARGYDARRRSNFASDAELTLRQLARTGTRLLEIALDEHVKTDLSQLLDRINTARNAVFQELYGSSTR